MAVLAGKLAARRKDCAPLAGKSTLNRLELRRAEPTRYHKIACDGAAIEALFVDLFLEAHATPAQADRPRSRRHRRSAPRPPGRPLLPRLLRRLLLPAAVHLLRPPSARGQAAARRHRRLGRGGRGDRRASWRQIRSRWPQVQIVLRADCGFSREELMSWCEANGVDYSSAWPRTRGWSPRSRRAGRGREDERGHRPAGAPLQGVLLVDARQLEPPAAGGGQGRWTAGAANPRFVVTSLEPEDATRRSRSTRRIYCARGEMENRIKECQLDLFADRTSAATN